MSARTRAVLGALPLLFAVACGGDDAPADAGDAGPPDAPVDRATPPAFDPPIAPAEAALPVLSPCPPGWGQVGESPVRCEPWPSSGPAACPAGSAAFASAGGCATVGRACPSDEWPAELPASGVLYVRAGAAIGGDGTRDQPYATIGEALAVAAAGDTIAIAKGAYEETIAIGAGVTVRGACAGETSIGASTTAVGQIVHLAGDGARIEDVRLTGDDAGVRADGPVSVSAAGVIVDGAMLVGVLAQNGATLDARDVAVIGMRAHPDRGLGIGIGAIGAANLTVERAYVERAIQYAVFTLESSTVTVTDGAVRDTRGGDDGLGFGLAIALGGRLVASRVVVEQSIGAGVYAQEGSVVLEDAIVRDTRAEAISTMGGIGLALFGGIDATVRRAVFERNRVSGVSAIDESAHAIVASFEDVVFREGLPEEGTGLHGEGITIVGGTDATFDRVLVDRAVEVGVVTAAATTSLVMRDLVVRDTQPRATGEHGRGMTIETAAHVTLDRARFESNREIAIGVTDPSTELVASDLVVTGTLARPDGHAGRAVNAQAGGRAVITRATFARNLEVSVFAHGLDTSVELRDVAIRETLERACTTTTCADSPAGSGVVVLGGASGAVERFSIADSAFCGIQIGPDATFTASNGEVVRNAIGVNLQNPAISLEMLSDRVWFADNGQTLDASRLPLPEPPVD